MSDPVKQALSEEIAKAEDRAMLSLMAPTDTAQVCDAIAGLQLLTVSDAANIVRALGIRAAGTPLMMPGRSELCTIITNTERDLLNLWTRGS